MNATHSASQAAADYLLRFRSLSRRLILLKVPSHGGPRVDAVVCAGAPP